MALRFLGRLALMISDEERAENRLRYWAVMGPQYAAQLEADRSAVVLRHREAIFEAGGDPEVEDRSALWPDGLPWYRAAEWAVVRDEKGEWAARRKAGVEIPPFPHDEARVEAYRARVEAAKAVLAEVEARVGVKPAVAGEGDRLPWVAAGLSRRTYYRRKARGEI